MTLKRVISLVLCIVMILACVGGFTAFLIFADDGGVADALSATLPADGMIGANLIDDSYYTQFSDSSLWTLNYSDCTYSLQDGYLNIKGEPASNRYVSLLEYNGSIDYTVSSSYTFTFYFRVNSGYLAFAFYENLFSGGFTSVSLNIMTGDTSSLHVVSVVYSVGSKPGYLNNFKLCSGLSSTSSSFDVDLVYIKIEEGSSFTGYAIDSNGSYEDGFNDGQSADYEQGYNAGFNDGKTDGYQDGYEAGVADGIVSANDIFLCSAFDIAYDSSKNLVYINPDTSDAYTSYINVMVNSFSMVFVPLSCLYYDDVDGGFYPSDIVRNADGELPDVSSSSYILRFSNLLDVGQWLLDNPNDYLCSYVITGESEPAAIVFSDLSKLSSFMSGAGENYQNGYDDGYDSGYSSGQSAGYNKGYSAGYSKGSSDTNEYTFFGLIGAVLDAPISAFRGLLDFDLLGVNLSAFVTAMLSLCIVFALLKLILR